MNRFDDVELPDSLKRAVAEAGYTAMTPVQAQSLPAILAGRDVLAQAQTGSGKTAAFALGMLSRLDPGRTALQGLVLCPTRELADQVSREIRRLACFIPNVKVLTLYGGVPLGAHLASLSHQPHITVGTPGRLLDVIRRGAMPLDALRILVLDEADRLLDMGFEESLRAIVARTPRSRQTLLFSATIPEPIRELSREYQRDPLDVTIARRGDPIEQVFHEVDDGKRLEALVAVLLAHRPERVVVFCNYKEDVRNVTAELRTRGFSALALHGDLDQREREEALVQFANNSVNVLVASDVAARGLDISGLPMVVNFDLAPDPDVHVHRIGRTGRAGQSGLAINLVRSRERRRAEIIEARDGEALMWMPLPRVDAGTEPLQAPFVTLAIDAGRQDKIRPGDLLGALTGEAAIQATAVGKIEITPVRSYVALERRQASQALSRLRAGKIKNRRLRVRRLTPR